MAEEQMKTEAQETREVQTNAENHAPRPRKRKKEREYRRVKSVPPMTAMIPFIMVNRVGAQNFIHDTTDVEKLERYNDRLSQTLNEAKKKYEKLKARNKELGRFENPPPASELHVILLILRSGYDCHAEVHKGTPCESYICYQAEIGKRSW